MLGYEPTDGDIVQDLGHPQGTGMVCGGERIRDGVRGVWVEWDASEWAADFEPAPYARIGTVISTQAQRDEAKQAARRAEEAAGAARRAHVDSVLEAVRPTLARMATREGRVADFMWPIYRPIEGVELRRDGRRTEVIVAGHVVAHTQWSGSHSGGCHLCGSLRLFDVSTEAKALNGVQEHLLAAHASANRSAEWLLPSTLPVKVA